MNKRNLDRSMVRTSDFKSENLGSIPSRGAFLLSVSFVYFFLIVMFLGFNHHLQDHHVQIGDVYK